MHPSQLPLAPCFIRVNDNSEETEAAEPRYTSRFAKEACFVFAPNAAHCFSFVTVAFASASEATWAHVWVF